MLSRMTSFLAGALCRLAAHGEIVVLWRFGENRDRFILQRNVSGVRLGNVSGVRFAKLQTSGMNIATLQA